MVRARGAHVGAVGMGWGALGVALTIGTTFVAALPRGWIVVAVLLATIAFLAATWCFLVAPHVAFAVAVPVFVCLPALKVFAGQELGPVKDGVIAAAGLALLISLLMNRLDSPALRADRLLVACMGLFAALYLLSPLGPHGDAWFHSVRLALEPLVLLLAAMFIPADRARVWSWLQWSTILTCVPVALYGLLQQALGVDGLLALGYTYGEQIRQIDGRLRSFGTLDDAFAYSAVLTLGLALLFLSQSSAQVKWALGLPIALGLAAALVRTSLLTCVLVFAVWLLSKGQAPAALVLLCSALAVAGLIVARADTAQTTVVTTASGPLTLNGRVGAWEAAVGGPENWPLGRGPGSTGTAAERASGVLLTTSTGSARSVDSQAVDSGYLGVVADVGLVGLGLLLTLLARLAYRARLAASAGSPAGWSALAVVAVLAGDAVTRSSFTAFPTAVLAFALLGAAVAAAESDARGVTEPWGLGTRPREIAE